MFLHLTGRGGEDGYIHMSEFADVGNNLILSDFCGYNVYIAAHYACNLEVRSSLKSFHGETANIAIADHRSTYFSHKQLILKSTRQNYELFFNMSRI